MGTRSHIIVCAMGAALTFSSCSSTWSQIVQTRMQMDEELGDLTTAESISIVTAKGNALFRFRMISPIHTSKQCTRISKNTRSIHAELYIYNIISYLIQSYHFFLRIANQTFKTRDPQCFENTTCFGPMTHEDCWNLLNLPTFPPNRWLHCTMLSSRGLPKKCSA